MITPKTASLSELRSMRREVLRWLASRDDAAVLDRLNWHSYHGFDKAVLPEPFHTELLAAYGYTSHDVQAEIVRVTCDLCGEIHYHEEATACIAIVGQTEHLPDPVEASMFMVQRWFPVQAPRNVDIRAGVRHGFTVKPGGILYFLSIQSPPITGPDGRNDYHK